jgi:hypothetical protein
MDLNSVPSGFSFQMVKDIFDRTPLSDVLAFQSDMDSSAEIQEGPTILFLSNHVEFINGTTELVRGVHFNFFFIHILMARIF